MKIKSLLFCLSIFAFFIACKTRRNVFTGENSILFLDEYIIPNKTTFQNTAVGGLSGIDYVAAQKCYYAICDDRSNLNPARFYRLSFEVINNKIADFKILSVDTLRQQNGEVYPNKNINSNIVPDPESLRYNAATHAIAWTSEGERILDSNGHHHILNDPAVYIADSTGKLQYSLPVPAQFAMSSEQSGSRRNGTFEGLSYTPDYQFLFVSMEEPLYQDGSNAKFKKGTYWCRIIKYDMKTKSPIAQYAYQLDKVQQMPVPPTAFAVNGISEIMALDEQRLVVVERSFSFGRLNTDVRLYLVNLQNATNIMNVASLKNNNMVKAAKKKLLYHFNKISTRMDNIEGITFGPRLPNGHRTLIVISDNNFLSFQKTQLLLLDAGNL